ncbi:MAG: diguanylate cyclase [Candidatus Dormibacteraeota bacterium]|nr:diguanylate cyclase [Candidatus Dormibacteraeota bacterium]
MAQSPDTRRRRRRASFTTQFALILLGVGLATALAAAAVAWYETQTARSTQLLVSAQGSAHLGLGLVRLETSEVSAGLACRLAGLPRTADAYHSGVAGLSSYASSTVSANPGHYLLFLNSQGRILAGSAAGTPLRRLQPLVTGLLSPAQQCTRGGFFERFGNRILGAATAPVRNGGQDLGVVAVLTPVSAASVNYAAQLISSQGITSQALLVGSGRVLLPATLASTTIGSEAPLPEAVRAALASPGEVGSGTIRSRSLTLAGVPLLNNHGRAVATLVVSQSATSVGPSAEQLAVPVTLAVASVLLLGMVVVFLLAERFLNRPLRRLNEAVQRLGQDVYAEPVRVEGSEEVSRLAANFEIMRRQLRHQVILAVGRSVIASTLTGNAPLEQSLSQVLMNLCRVVEAEMAMILLRPTEPSGLSFLITWGIADPALEWSELESGDGIIGDLLRRPRFLARPLLTTQERGELERRLGLRDCLAEPLQSEGRILGLLVVANKRRPYLEEDRALCNTVAAQVVSAVDKSMQLVVTRREATTDAMTGLYNYRFLIGYLDQQVNVAERANSSLSVLMLDLDHFKAINDSHGHLVGDRVLRSVSSLVIDTIRKSDLAARYGGEEFVVVMANTGREDAYLVAEKIRGAVAALPIMLDDQSTVRVTVSIGGVSFPEGTRGARNLLDLADRALYAAKRAGRDRVEFLDLAAPGDPSAST